MAAGGSCDFRAVEGAVVEEADEERAGLEANLTNLSFLHIGSWARRSEDFLTPLLFAARRKLRLCGNNFPGMGRPLQGGREWAEQSSAWPASRGVGEGGCPAAGVVQTRTLGWGPSEGEPIPGLWGCRGCGGGPAGQA